MPITINGLPPSTAQQLEFRNAFGIEPRLTAIESAVQAAVQELALKAAASALVNKQDALISGTNIKTVGGQSILGTGDIPLPSGGGSTVIVNDLTTGGPTSAASAETVKTLKTQVDTKADAAATTAALAAKQNTLVSGMNVKTVGGQSILGTGDIPLPSGGGSTVVINDLTTGGTTAALSAEQGKTLKTQVDAKADAAATAASLAVKQNSLVSGTNLKTVGGQSLLGSGDVPLPSAATDQSVVRALSRNMGAQSALVAGSGMSGAVSVNAGFMGKWEAEAPFKRARLWMFSKEPHNVSRGWQFMVASTETAAMDTVNNSYRPIVGGTAHNTYASIGRPWPVKGNDRYGWRKGTWGGSPKSGILHPAATPIPSFGQYTVSRPLVSDWIDCPSVPRADGGTRPLLVFGLTKDAFGADSYSNYSASINGVNGISLMSEEYKALTEGASWARLQLCVQAAVADYNVVNDLTKAPAVANWLAAGAGGMPYLAWEFEYDAPVRSWWGVGDSQTEAKHGTAGVLTYLLWWLMAVNGASTPAAPIQALNVGMATNRTANFRDQFFAMLQSGALPTDVLYPNYSVNNSAPISAFTFEDLYQQQAELLEVIETCRKLGIRLYLWTNPNIDPGAANAVGWEGNSAMAMLHAWTRQVCAAGAATLVDIEANFNRSTMYIDGTHFNNLGDTYAAGVLSAVI